MNEKLVSARAEAARLSVPVMMLEELARLGVVEPASIHGSSFKFRAGSVPGRDALIRLGLKECDKEVGVAANICNTLSVEFASLSAEFRALKGRLAEPHKGKTIPHMIEHRDADNPWSSESLVERLRETSARAARWLMWLQAT